MSDKDRSNLASAIEAALRAPSDDAAWEAVESIAAKLDSPDDVAAAYVRALGGKLDADEAEALGQRAARFHDEWYGQDASGNLAQLLGRVLELAPRSDWAFQRLSVALTVSERWDDLLALYDSALDHTSDKARQEKLLDEAYQIAKDLAGKPVEAIAYLRRLYSLTRDVKQARELERLLEKHDNFKELVQFLEQRIEHVAAAERPTVRLRIARTWFENLRDADRALDTVRLLLAEPGRETAEPGASELLERLATAPEASPDVREGALDLLREHHDAAGRADDIVRVVEAALPLADLEGQIALHRDAAKRLAEIGKHDAAIEHYATLLRLDPSSQGTQRELRQLAQANDRLDRYADAAADAAERCADPARKVALLSDAARARLELEDEAGAVEYLAAALGEPNIPRTDILHIARRLDELLARGNRTAERLPVLEKLAAAETVPSSQRAIIGDIARLAEDLGDADRALAAWRQRLVTNPADVLALNAVVDLLERESRWVELVEALELRVASAARPGQKRNDLVRVARIHDRELHSAEGAIAAWNRIIEEIDGATRNPDVVVALTDLYTATGKWKEMGELLEGATGQETVLLVEQLVKLGDASRQHLGAPERALVYYHRALDVDSRHDRARAGLIPLLEYPTCRAGAAEALGRAYRSTEDWPSYLSLVEARLVNAADDDERLRILREAAAIHERIGDSKAALEALARAFPLAPKDRALADQVVRLARHVGQFERAIESIQQAAGALKDDAHGAAQLRAREAELLEDQGDLEGAHTAHFAVLSVDPGNLAATQAVVRIGSRLGKWVEVAAAICDCIRTRGRLDEALLGEIDAAAGETHTYDDMCKVLSIAVDQGGLEPHIAAELHVRIAAWHGDRRADPQAAKVSLRRAIACDATRHDALRKLVALEEQTPDRDLYDTLVRLGDADARDLDVVHRAAELASDTLADRGLAKTSLTALLGRATAAWRGTAPARGRLPASDYVAWAIGKLVDLHVAGQEANAALDLLVDASRLPFDADTRLSMRHRAAVIAEEVLHDDAGAIDMFRGILGQKPDDTEAITRLAGLYRKQDRAAELLALRRHQLTLPLETPQRIELRLELVSLIDDIDRRGGRLELLRANLADTPGDAASVAAVSELLGAAGRHRELCDLLSEQARRLEAEGGADRAAGLWAQTARIAEKELREPDRSIAAYRRVIALAPTQEALDALARLFMERGEPSEAVPWLERALTGAEVGRRAELSLRLARAHLGAQRTDRAIASLERAVADGAGNREVRTLLAELYRTAERWEPLARLLTDSLPMLGEEEVAAAWAREAAEIFHHRLKAPEQALPALERALALAPDDKAVRAMMAGSLRASGDTGRARELLEGLVADFGRRRSKERAQVHVELGLVARAEGKLDEAVAELENASQMDVGNAQVLKLLAQLAREGNKLEQAERSLRALLLLVRRQPPGDDTEAVGLAEVLYELGAIAKERGDEEKSTELFESALEAARQNDPELVRLRRSLVAHKAGDVLLRAVDHRLTQSEEGTISKATLLSFAAEGEDLSGRPRAALDRLLAAMELEPGRLDFHARARDMARRASALPRYLEVAAAELERLRRGEDAPRVSELAIALARLAEEDSVDLPRARSLYEMAARATETPSDALYGLSRVCALMGDIDGQTRALDELAALAGDDEQTPERADALYRLATVQADAHEMVGRALELLERAMRIEVRHGEAAAILKRAAAASPDRAEVLDLYERVARGSGDPAMLLDYLERRIERDGAEEHLVREAVELAGRADEPQRGEKLLRSAVAAAREGLGVATGAVWAALALARLCIARGELDETQRLLQEVGEAGPAQETTELGLELARRASESNRLALAAETYEVLRQRDPGSSAVWEPLFDLHHKLGDDSSLQLLVSQTLPNLVSTGDRNALRLRYARYLIVETRSREAIDVLRDALLDDPDNLEVSALLESVLSEGGNDEALADFLAQRFEEARERGNPDTLTDVALRLGALLERLGTGDAVSVYRDALAYAPESRDLLRAVVGALSADDVTIERAELTERLLAVESADRGAALAVELSALWEQLGDGDRALRALELGHRASPHDTAIRDRLEATFRETGAWDRLAAMLINEADHATDQTAALLGLREAAALYRDRLADVKGALGVLRRARAIAPDDMELLLELASSLAASGDATAAMALVGEQLDRGGSATQRVDLLLLRSDMALSVDRIDESLADLEEAYALDPGRSAQLLQAGLERQRELSRERMDLEGERNATMRLARILVDAGHEVHARDMLVHWLERAVSDQEALYMVLGMDSAAERWDGVVAVCARLVTLEQGEEQVAAATRLAEAAEKCDMEPIAQQGLEYVHQLQPDVLSIRDLLRRIYEKAGSYRELAALLLADAEHATDDDTRYQCYRQAADLLVNKLGDTEAAVLPAQRARELKPDDHETVLLVGDVLIASGQIREAVELLMPAIDAIKRRSPELAALQYRMARAAGATGDRDTQLAWLKRAFDVDRKDGNIAAELAQLATELGDYELALKPLRAITLSDSPGPITRVMALLWEAKIEHARGNKAKAELWAKKALREDPSFAEAEEFLSQLAE